MTPQAEGPARGSGEAACLPSGQELAPPGQPCYGTAGLSSGAWIHLSPRVHGSFVFLRPGIPEGRDDSAG